MLSLLGKNAEDLLKTLKHHLDHLQPDRLDSTLTTFQTTATTLLTLTGDLTASDIAQLVQKIKSTLFFTQVLILVSIILGIYLTRKLTRYGFGIYKSLRVSSAASEVQKNLDYQVRFAESVHRFIEYQDKLHKSDSAIKPIIRRFGPWVAAAKEQWIYVYHPGSDWHAAFYETSCRVANFKGIADSLPALMEQIRELRERQKDDEWPVVHILLPSAHSYELPTELDFPAELRPVRVTGQKDCHGRPYCRGVIRGVAEGAVVDVEVLRPKERKTSRFPARFSRVGLGGVVFVGLLMWMVLDGQYDQSSSGVGQETAPTTTAVQVFV